MVEIYSSSVTENILNTIRKWGEKFGYPKTILSDNGNQYLSNEIKQFFENTSIKHVTTPVYSSFSNGISVRIFKTIGEVIRIYKNKTVKNIQRKLEIRLNFTYNNTIATLPIFAVQNDDFKLELVNKNICSKHIEFNLQDKVLIKNFNVTKMEERYRGPFEILEKGRNGLWYKTNESDNWYHVKHLKIWRE